MNDQLASIIIRTKDEEEWVGRCLDMVKKQTHSNYEIIIVDTGSTDGTLDIVKKYPECKLIQYNEDYMPGKALNYGCKEAVGEYMVFISAHCIPVNSVWLEHLLKDLEDPHVAGVYGKQEPMEDTNPFDQRDLILTFGLDKKVQWKDPFFHNANSAIRSQLWKELPFNEELTNIEDRIWAANMQKRGFCLVYEPEARVLHHHGIHQTGNKIRCAGVNRIMEDLHSYIEQEEQNNGNIEKNKIHTVIPFSQKINKRLSFEQVAKLYTALVEDLRGISNIDAIYLLSDCERLIEFSQKNFSNIIIPYTRHDDSHETLVGVLQHFIENQKIHGNDSILVTELIYLATNRTKYFTELCKQYNESNKQSGIWVSKKFNSFFKKICGDYYRLDENIGGLKGYRNPFFETEDAFGRIFHAQNIRNGYFHSKDILLIEKSDEDLAVKVDKDELIASFKNINI
ncbi:MAG: glycosyltransferase family 2 protein [bacterium]|nr:glycosyltransferase family 2 protein [bacterium]